MDVALHIQQFLSCHGAYATGALGDQKIPARRLRVIGGKFLVLHSAFAWNLMEVMGSQWISSRSRQRILGKWGMIRAST